MTPVRFQNQNRAGHPRGNPQIKVEVPSSYRRPRRRLEGFRPNPAARLLDQCREVLRFHHFLYARHEAAGNRGAEPVGSMGMRGTADFAEYADGTTA